MAVLIDTVINSKYLWLFRKAGHGPDGWMVGPEVDHTSFMVTTRNQVRVAFSEPGLYINPSNPDQGIMDPLDCFLKGSTNSKTVQITES